MNELSKLQEELSMQFIEIYKRDVDPRSQKVLVSLLLSNAIIKAYELGKQELINK